MTLPETPETDAVVLSKDYVLFCGAPAVEIVPAEKMRQLELRNRRLVEALQWIAGHARYADEDSEVALDVAVNLARKALADQQEEKT